jgi:hypothetical protein
MRFNPTTLFSLHSACDANDDCRKKEPYTSSLPSPAVVSVVVEVEGTVRCVVVPSADVPPKFIAPWS